MYCTAVGHNKNNPLAIRSQIYTLDCSNSWNDYFLRGNPPCDFFFVSIRGLNTALCYGPR
jgi:hypothetical protein